MKAVIRDIISVALVFLCNLAQEHLCAVFPFNPDTSFVTIQSQSNIFYWLFEPRNAPKETAPVVIFLDGGPGCSTTYSLFDFIGPLYVENYKFDPKTQTFVGKKEADVRTNAWNDKSYLLIIDQPVGMGFSQVGSYEEVSKDAEDIRNNFLLFLNAFFDKHSDLQGRDLFVTGHSYAGHYIPYTVTKLLESGFNKATIKGISIGNPYVNGKILFQSYPSFAVLNKQYTNVPQEAADRTKPISQLCGHLFDLPQNRLYQIPTLEICQAIAASLQSYLPKNFDVNYMPSDWKYNKSYEVFLNDAEVQSYLNFDKSSSQFMPFLSCNDTFRQAFFNWDWKTDSRSYLVKILERKEIRVLIYAGDLDFRCNFQQTETLLDTMKWSGKTDWNLAQFQDSKYGKIKLADNLTYIRFSGAGHTVPLYEEEKALGMINDFLQDQLKPQ